MRVQMLGLCRFSYLGGRGFQVTHASLEERRAFLYDPERLARRWFWFKHVTLPGLLAQTDPDFTLVLMTGPDLPEPYLSHLREAADMAPQFRLSLVPAMEKHLDACRAAILPHIEGNAAVIGHFRQDDDDAIAVDYIENARRDFADLRPLWGRRRRLSCDYAHGLVLKATNKGIGVEARVIHNASAALTVYLSPEAPSSAVHFPHWKIGLSMPGVTLADRLMFVRLINQDNDSGAVGAGYGIDAIDANWRKLLADRFRIDLPAIKQGARELGLVLRPSPAWGS